MSTAAPTDAIAFGVGVGGDGGQTKVPSLVVTAYYSITLDQCATMLDVFVAAEGEPEVVMFSGGEPTIHKDILAMIDLAQARPINSVNLNTNGIRLASDTRFVAELGRRNRPGRRVNIYLQFDGLDAATHRAIRRRDLREIKQRALDNCAAAGLTVTLVAAIEKDLNEHEIGPVIRHGLAHPAVRSVAFQPVTHSGRHVVFDPLTRLTNSDILHAIAAQLPQWFTTEDFFPVPCCAPTCRSITYLLTQGHPDDPDFGLVPIPRLLQVEDYLDYVANRVVPDHDIREALERLWSASAFLGTDTSDDRLTRVAEASTVPTPAGSTSPRLGSRRCNAPSTTSRPRPRGGSPNGADLGCQEGH